MPRFTDFEPTGVIPAALLPFDEEFRIDEAATRRHLRDVCATEGISAVTVNAHASEVHACSFDEQRRVLDLAVEEVGSRLPIVNGVYADGSLEAARIARMAEDGGAWRVRTCLSWTAGGDQSLMARIVGTASIIASSVSIG